ncbi:TetR/AcrR family transcriptional regulator [Streptomyces sp. NPDC050400]|uniref:TetR/AcrR family transcriptional regulator n=1 Tax=Streptomyces sp. NPDC050400 TaxID=3365610 RepID=UPI00379EE5DD
MGRWEPNSRERLFAAALELYAERGYEQTTVAEIARRAGLTERTFFRHFPDKREVLFLGSAVMEEQLTKVVTEAPASASPLTAVAAAIEAVSAGMQERQDSVLVRQSVVAAHAELRERELIKRAKLAATMTEALGARGVDPLAARLSAEAGTAVFHVAFERWVEDRGRTRGLVDLVREGFEVLRTVAGGERT